MKKCFVILLAALIALTAAFACAEQETLVSGDYSYVLLEDGSACITKFAGQAEFLTVPAELDGHAVTAIGENAFYGCNAKSVTIPEGITTLSAGAFKYAYMTRLTLPDSLVTLNGNPFEGCRQLDTVRLSENSQFTVDNHALIFKPGMRLLLVLEGRFGSIPFELGDYTVPAGVRIIDSGAFSNTDSLTAVSLPDSLRQIGPNAFYSCKNLTEVTLYTVDGMDQALSADDPFVIDTYAFSRCVSLTSVTLPENTVSIGFMAFNECASLAAINFPEALESIEDSAFSGCTSLTEIDLKKVTAIGSNAFQNCTALTHVSLPETMEKIGMGVFSGCAKLSRLRMYSDVPENMFSGMTALRTVELLEGAKSIGRRAFSGCAALESVTLPDSMMSISQDAFEGCDKINMIVPKGSYAEQFADYYGIPFTYAE